MVEDRKELLDEGGPDKRRISSIHKKNYQVSVRYKQGGPSIEELLKRHILSKKA